MCDDVSKRTIAELRRDGATSLQITCANPLCVWSVREPLDALGLAETQGVVDARASLGLVCSACGSNDFTLSLN